MNLVFISCKFSFCNSLTDQLLLLLGWLNDSVIDLKLSLNLLYHLHLLNLKRIILMNHLNLKPLTSEWVSIFKTLVLRVCTHYYERGRRPCEFSLNMKIFSTWATRPTDPTGARFHQVNIFRNIFSILCVQSMQVILFGCITCIYAALKYAWSRRACTRRGRGLFRPTNQRSRHYFYLYAY